MGNMTTAHGLLVREVAAAGVAGVSLVEIMQADALDSLPCNIVMLTLDRATRIGRVVKTDGGRYVAREFAA